MYEAKPKASTSWGKKHSGIKFIYYGALKTKPLEDREFEFVYIL